MQPACSPILARGALTPLILAFLIGCSSEQNPGLSVGTSGGSGGNLGGSGGAAGSGTTSGGAITMGGSINIGGGSLGGGAGPECKGINCDKTTCTFGNCTQKACDAGAKTTVSGTVFDPAGKVPLYNVVVYVPNGPVPPFTPGASCDRCGLTVQNPAASALTDTHGKFVLQDVPVGPEVPLVMQVGKWRRQIKIPVTRCIDNALTDVNQTRLPKNKAEGDIPLIAITTGGADSMECLPRRMGIEDSEFTTGTGEGRIHLYAGSDNVAGGAMDIATKTFDPGLNGGVALQSAKDLWSTTDALRRYDIVIMSCEGNTREMDKPMSARQAMYDYVSLGGRAFASHWHRIWFSHGPAPLPQTGTWRDRNQAPPDPSIGTINTSFPKGQALAEWLVNVQASTTPGQLSINEPRDNIQAVNEMYATRWITVQNTNQSTDQETVQYLSFNAPLDAAEDMKCGRAVFTDLHVSTTGATGVDTRGVPFPTGCQMRDLSAQEKAVEFMLFDLSSCIQNDKDPPVPPPPF